jgi:prepilin-type N-terminal cleavage/methylation domain-containing protein/prepilin-type processing-associated H-X9-DG protein
LHHLYSRRKKAAEPDSILSFAGTVRHGSGGFTLLEIATVVVIIGILASLIYPVFKGFRGRAEAVKCAGNIKGLGVGVQAYMTDHSGCWPQIAVAKNDGEGNVDASPVSNRAKDLATQWIAALSPYGIAEATWHCPSMERQLKQLAKKEALDMKRIDYTPTIFDSKPESATKWPKHPWFVERAAIHGTGPNVLFADGSVSNLSELSKSPWLSR